jgi:hypothetical protein
MANGAWAALDRYPLSLGRMLPPNLEGSGLEGMRPISFNGRQLFTTPSL